MFSKKRIVVFVTVIISSLTIMLNASDCGLYSTDASCTCSSDTVKTKNTLSDCTSKEQKSIFFRCRDKQSALVENCSWIEKDLE